MLFTILPRENFRRLIDQIPGIIFLKTWQKERQLVGSRSHKFLLRCRLAPIQAQKSSSLHSQIPFITVCKRVMTLENLPPHSVMMLSLLPPVAQCLNLV